jgi:putative tricarboxylic transport membrane protein
MLPQKELLKTRINSAREVRKGIVASESANNATVGGALIPLIALGIPGSVIGAVLLGALIVHGLQPGPLLFRQNPEAVHAIIGTVLVANLMMFLIMLICARWMAKLSLIPKNILFPAVTLCCVWGAYALNGLWFDVIVMFVFGLLGCLMERYKLPLAAFVIGFVLAPGRRRKTCVPGLMASGGSYAPLVTRPISLCLLAFWLAPYFYGKRKNRQTRLKYLKVHSMSKRPNILWYCTDQQRFDTYSRPR